MFYTVSMSSHDANSNFADESQGATNAKKPAKPKNSLADAVDCAATLVLGRRKHIFRMTLMTIQND
jgi:hypothetical protein